MAEELTAQQKLAVNNQGGRLLVSAAAGSGKTKVLVDRLMRYLTDPADPANIDDFLIITFTKAAAAELRGKIAAKLGERIAQEQGNRHLQKQTQRLYLAKISTVHAFCSDLLREYAYRLDIPGDFRMADENESLELRRQVIEQLLDEAYSQETPGEDFLAFVDSQGLGRTDAMVADIILQIYDSARCHMDPDGWLSQCLIEDKQWDQASETPWGAFLMSDLFDCLDRLTGAMQWCEEQLSKEPDLAKQAGQLRDERMQMEFLRQAKTWDEVVQRKELRFDTLRFPKEHCYSPPSLRVKEIRKTAKNLLGKKLENFTASSKETLSDLKASVPAVRGLVNLVKRFSEMYQTLKRGYRILDFDDLEHITLDLLLGKGRSGPTAVAGELARRFREVMVDEYQDTNEVQDACFNAMTYLRNNLFMVGDVKQSIYQFRLADPGIFLKKYLEYAPAEQAVPGQGRKVLLSKNFRSGPGILSAVNDVFSGCMYPKTGGLRYGPEEALQEGIAHDKLPEPEVELYCLEAEKDRYAEEAAFTARRILALLDGTHMIRQEKNLRPIRPEDIVILLRSPGPVGGEYRQALEKVGLRCYMEKEGDLRSTQEGETLTAILRTVSNPRQDIPLLSTLASPLFGFTADDLAAIRAKNRNVTFYDALIRDPSEKSRRAHALLEALREEARLNTLTGLLEKLILGTHMESIYGAMPEGKVRIARIQSFFQLAADFEARGGKGLEAFLEHLRTAKSMRAPGEKAPANAIRIMSIHSSKGLEYPVVFLCGLSRQIELKYLQSARVLQHKDLGLGCINVDEKNRIRYPNLAKKAILEKSRQEILAEEMRLLYVAMTRARDRLIMTYTDAKLAKHLMEQTMLLDGCSDELLAAMGDCPGWWVLMAALRRAEAGALFFLGERPEKCIVSTYPWNIVTATLSEEEKPTEGEKQGEQGREKPELDGVFRAVSYQYPYDPATRAPSKQTATQRKGREKDQEAAENAPEQSPVQRVWRKPSFAGGQIQGTAYGTAIHEVMRQIRFEHCGSEAEVRSEIDRLVEKEYLTPEQGRLAQPGEIAAFFATPLGRRLREGGNVLREYKFSILDDGRAFAPGLQGEKILLQGVVDCALLEDNGITVVDFKTDRVTEQTIGAKILYYRPQVEAYASALSRIFQKPVVEKYLYFFHMNRLVTL